MNKLAYFIKSIKKNPDNICPIIVSEEGIVLDGNHRVIAARKAGVKKIKAVIIIGKIIEIDINTLQLGWQPNEYIQKK